MKVTMKDIAIHSGWSLGTVSNVFSNKPGVSLKAKKEVLETAKRLGYQKNETASLLRQKQPRGIVLIVRNDYCPVYWRLAVALKTKLIAQGYSVRLLKVELGEDEVQKAIQIQQVQPATLLVFFGARRDAFRKINGRTLGSAISIGSDMRELNLAWLSSYFWPFSEMSQQATEWLFEANCQHIGVLLEDRFLSSELADFFLGIQYGFYLRNKIFRAKDQMVIKPFSLQGGYEGFIELKAKMAQLDGLLIFSSLQAAGVLRAAKDLGIKIPEDLSILVCDQDHLAPYTIPSLCSLNQDEKYDLTQIFTMIEALQDPQNLFPSLDHQEAPWSMTWRESCLKPSLKESSISKALNQEIQKKGK